MGKQMRHRDIADNEALLLHKILSHLGYWIFRNNIVRF